MGYHEFLPWLVKMQGARNYLEIGVNMGQLLSKIEVENAIGIDPSFILNENIANNKRRVFLYRITSDQFFSEEESQISRYPPDVAFLDGMHLFEYLLRDFYKTEACCTSESLIVLHDCLPISTGMCHRNQMRAAEITSGNPWCGMWTGDVWKIIPILRKFRPDLQVTLVDSSPTGLVCVSGLDPSSTVLKNAYLEIVREFSALSEDQERSMLAEPLDIVSANKMHEEMSHGQYFRN